MGIVDVGVAIISFIRAIISIISIFTNSWSLLHISATGQLTEPCECSEPFECTISNFGSGCLISSFGPAFCELWERNIRPRAKPNYSRFASQSMAHTLSEMSATISSCAYSMCCGKGDRGVPNYDGADDHMVQNKLTCWRGKIPVGETWKKYVDHVGNAYHVVFKGNQVFHVAPNSEPIEVPIQYLNQFWVYWQRCWLVLPNRPPQQPASLESKWVYLALDVLPFWEEQILAQYSRADRKEWSHYGATTRNGDVGNDVYKVVIDGALRLRKLLQEQPLYTIAGMNRESKGDIIEGIMGLHWLRAQGWTKSAEVVDTLSSWVWQQWNDLYEDIWNQQELLDHLFRDAQCSWVEQMSEGMKQQRNASVRINLERAFYQCLPKSVRYVLYRFLRTDR